MNCSTCEIMLRELLKAVGKWQCLTNGCNQRTVYNWLSNLDNDSKKSNKWIELALKMAEKVRFNNKQIAIQTGDVVVIELAYGKDMGRYLTGHLVQFQMDRKCGKAIKRCSCYLRKHRKRY